MNSRNFVLALAALVVGSSVAVAGPPMICHPFDIGNQTSLPWSGGSAWNSPDPKYDIRNLTADTLKLLNPEKPVIARMETLRRAAIYASKNPDSARDLAVQLMARALDQETAQQKSLLAHFDAGYFIESVQQMGAINKAAPFANLNGSHWVRRSILAGASDPAIEYALSMMQPGPMLNDHYRRAVARAEDGSLLAKHLVLLAGKRSLGDLKNSLAQR